MVELEEIGPHVASLVVKIGGLPSKVPLDSLARAGLSLKLRSVFLPCFKKWLGVRYICGKRERRSWKSKKISSSLSSSSKLPGYQKTTLLSLFGAPQCDSSPPSVNSQVLQLLEDLKI